MAKALQVVEITKTVPVSDVETLAVWLDQELEGWLTPGDHDRDFAKVGSKAIALIKKAGFGLMLPSGLR